MTVLKVMELFKDSKNPARIFWITSYTDIRKNTERYTNVADKNATWKRKLEQFRFFTMY